MAKKNAGRSEKTSWKQKLDVYRKEYERIRDNLKPGECAKHDAAANKYMQAVNPKMRAFYLQKSEEFREWLNAWITWNWYVAGNPKSLVMIQNFGFARYIIEMYYAAMRWQITINGYCKPGRDLPPSDIIEPEIPNFKCPTVVGIPSGSDWPELSASVKNFDGNKFDIKQVPHPAAHTSVSFTTGNRIGQPGFDASIKSANGTVSANHTSPPTFQELINNYRNYKEEKRRKLMHHLRSLLEIQMVKDLLNKIFSADCSRPKPVKKKLKFVIGQGELTFEGPKIVKEGQTQNGYEIEYEDGSSEIYDEDGLECRLMRQLLTVKPILMI